MANELNDYRQDSAPLTTKRALCTHCHRPLRVCLCDLVVKTPNQVSVLLLQHPSEKNHPKGSVNLLQLSLAQCELRHGEIFKGLRAELNNSSYHNILLYPETENGNKPKTNMSSGQENRGTVPSWRSTSTSDPEQDQETATPIRLILLDGSWKKAYKILQLNPCLQELPRYQGPIPEAGAYTMRKAPKPGQLSSLEACCYALGELEQNRDRYHPLLSSFAEFNRRWQDQLEA